jgi:hypothetical protein
VTSTPSGTRGSYFLAVPAADMRPLPFAATDCSQAYSTGADQLADGGGAVGQATSTAFMLRL